VLDRKPELLGDDLDFALELVTARQVILVGRAREPVEIFLGAARRFGLRLVECVPQREHVLKSGEERLEQRPFRGQLVRLAVVPDGHPFADHGRSLVGRQFARDEAEQRRFTGTIGRHERHPVA
jgi:hypothetical protein